MNIAIKNPNASEIEMLINELKATYPISSRYSNAVPEDDGDEYELSTNQDEVLDIGIEDDFDFDYDGNH